MDKTTRRGGAREGAGRKSDGIKRKSTGFFVSEEECKAVKEFLKAFRIKKLTKI